MPQLKDWEKETAKKFLVDFWKLHGSYPKELEEKQVEAVVALLQSKKDSLLERLPAKKSAIPERETPQTYLQELGYNQCLEEVKKIIQAL